MKKVGQWFKSETSKGLIIRIAAGEQGDKGKWSPVFFIVFIDFTEGRPIADETSLNRSDIKDYEPTEKEIHKAIKFIFTDWWALEE
jgi:hypothetical protein